MRRIATALSVAGACILFVGCSGDDHPKAEKSSAASTTTTPTAKPLDKFALPKLLLNPEQVNLAMGAADMAVTTTHFGMSDDSATMEPRECLVIDGAAQEQVYADSGFTAERDQTLKEGDEFTHYVLQAAVLYPSAKQAKAFYDASAQQWPACEHFTQYPIRVGVGRGVHHERRRHAEHDLNSAERPRGRLGMWAGTDRQEQRRRGRQHLQRRSRRLSRQDCRPDRRQRGRPAAPSVGANRGIANLRSRLSSYSSTKTGMNRSVLVWYSA